MFTEGMDGCVKASTGPFRVRRGFTQRARERREFIFNWYPPCQIHFDIPAAKQLTNFSYPVRFSPAPSTPRSKEPSMQAAALTKLRQVRTSTANNFVSPLWITS